MAILFLLLSLLLLFLFLLLLLKRNPSSSCFMLSYSCYKPSDNLKLGTEASCRVVHRNKNLGWEQYKFLLKTIVSSGFGEETYSPQNVVAGKEADPSLADSLQELDDIFFQTIDDLFEKSKISPQGLRVSQLCSDRGLRVLRNG